MRHKTGVKYMFVTLAALLVAGVALAMPAMAAGDSTSASTGGNTLGIVFTVVLVALIAFFFVRFLIVLRKTPKAPNDTAQTPGRETRPYSSAKNPPARQVNTVQTENAVNRADR